MPKDPTFLEEFDLFFSLSYSGIEISPAQKEEIKSIFYAGAAIMCKISGELALMDNERQADFLLTKITNEITDHLRDYIAKRLDGLNRRGDERLN